MPSPRHCPRSLRYQVAGPNRQYVVVRDVRRARERINSGTDYRKVRALRAEHQGFDIVRCQLRLCLQEQRNRAARHPGCHACAA